MVMVVSVSWPWPLDWIKFHCIGDKVLVLVIRSGGRAARPRPRRGGPVQVRPWPFQRRGHRGGGDRELRPGAQQQHRAECERRECETSDSTNTNFLFLLQGVGSGYVCDFQEEALSFMCKLSEISPGLGQLSVSGGVIRSRYKSVKLGL